MLGLSFKPATDDVREAVALDVIREMAAAGATVKAFDPVALENAKKELGDIFEACQGSEEVARDADALVIATEWNEFRRLDLARIRQVMRQPILVDCKNIYDPPEMAQLGYHHIGIGRGGAGA